MKRLLSLVVAASTALTALSPLAASAAAPNGSLIKGMTSSSVYYLADGKRYAFPNESVFFTWYGDFSSVMTVSDTELASYQLAGNVTYRPGSRLVKIQTDPKVYAVSRYGILRWVNSEYMAALLYGQNWNTNVDDIPDTFFTNYLVGPSTDVSPAYAVASELSVTSILQNIRPAGFVPPVSTIPTPTPGSLTLTVTVSASEATLNQSVLVFANAAGNGSVSKLELYSDKSSMPIATCLSSTTCSATYTVTQAPQQTQFTAIAYDAMGNKILTPVDLRATLNVPATTSDILMSATPLTLAAGSRASFTSDAHTHEDLTSHKIYIHIPGEPNGILWKDCGAETFCSGSTPFYRTSQLYSKIVVGGQTLVSASVTITVSGGTAPKPTLTLLSKPAPNQAVLKLDAPSGETIGWSTIVEGTSPDTPALALCEYASCEITVQFSKATSYTGFTSVGGKLEASNTINVSP
jgi:hypothetical protein